MMKPKFDGYAAQYDAWFMENDNRQKGMGYNAAQKLADEHDRGIDLGIGF